MIALLDDNKEKKKIPGNILPGRCMALFVLYLDEKLAILELGCITVLLDLGCPTLQPPPTPPSFFLLFFQSQAR